MRSLLLLLLALVSVSSCVRKDARESELDDIESIIDAYPDSVLSLLQSVRVDSAAPQSVRAKYALVKSRALYKSMREIPDSLIEEAVDFYEHTDDREARMHSFLIRGYERLENSLSSAAITDLLKAEEEAAALNDHFNLGMIYRNIGRAYNQVKMFDKDVEYSKLAFNEFEVIGDSNYVYETLYENALAYHNNGDKENARRILDILKQRLSTNHKIPSKKQLCRLEAFMFIREGNYEKALDMLLSLKSDEGNHFQNIINLAIELQRYEIVDSMVNLLNDRDDSEYIPLNYWIDRENYEEGLKTALKEVDDLEGFYSSQMLHSFSGAINEYYYKCKEKAEQRVRRQYVIIVFVVSILVILALVGIVIYLKNKRAELYFIASANRMSQELQVQKESFSKEKGLVRIQSNFEGRISELDKLCVQYYALSASNNAQKKIASQVADIVDKLSTDSELFNEIEASIDKVYDNIYVRFRADFPDLKSIDYRLFIYRAAGFSVNAINLFLGESSKSIYNRTYRMKKRIEKSDSNHKSDYLRIID